MISDDLVTGLRIGAIAIFTWLAWRVIFESWGVTGHTEGRREHAWRYLRASILVMCFVMVCLASPANILFANGLISKSVNFWMMGGVTIFACVYATLIHHGLDIINSRRPVTWVASVLIMGSSAVFGLVRAL